MATVRSASTHPGRSDSVCRLLQRPGASPSAPEAACSFGVGTPVQDHGESEAGCLGPMAHLHARQSAGPRATATRRKRDAKIFRSKLAYGAHCFPLSAANAPIRLHQGPQVAFVALVHPAYPKGAIGAPGGWQ